MHADRADRQQVADRLGWRSHSSPSGSPSGCFANIPGGGFDTEQIERARLLHFLGQRGFPPTAASDVVEATQAISGPLREVIEPAILYFHRKAWERALREDLTLHLGPRADGSPVATMNVAVLFVDTSGFTPLTDARGDSVNVRERARAAAHIPPLRIGAHVGTALYRDGDYVGATVNVAARATAEAGPGEFLVTEEVRRVCADSLTPTLRFELTDRHAKGIADHQHLYAVEPATSLRDQRAAKSRLHCRRASRRVRSWPRGCGDI